MVSARSFACLKIPSDGQSWHHVFMPFLWPLMPLLPMGHRNVQGDASGAVPKRRALAVPEPRKMVHVLGVNLAVFDSAPSSHLPVLVALHAIGHGGGDYTSLAAYLGGRFRVVIVDWPGHGASEKDTEPASIERYTRLLEGVIEALSLPAVVLLGNSIGGGVAVRFAATHPAQVLGLVLCNPAGFDPGGAFARLLTRGLTSRFRAGVEGRHGYGRWFAHYYEKILVTAEAKPRRDLIVEAAFETAPLLREAWSSFAEPVSDQRALAKDLRMPVLVAWADRDRLVQWARNRKAITSIPHRRVVHFQAGHSPFLETSKAFFSALDAFLAETVLSRREA